MSSGTSDLRSPRRLARDRRGAAALEFALVALAFFYLLIGTLELGRYFVTQHSVRTVVAEAARSAWVNAPAGGCGALTTAQRTAAESFSPFLSVAQLTLTLATGNAAGVSTTTTTATYPFTSYMPLLTGLTGTITETTQLSYPTPLGC